MISVYVFTSISLFCSTIWPCIFTLAVSSIEKQTIQGSSLMIMMIMVGGIISWSQGFVSDSIGIQNSYIVRILCCAYLAFYAWKVSEILRPQNY